MTDKRTPAVTNPTADVGEYLSELMKFTGQIENAMGGYLITVFHTKAFPWDAVFKALLYRGFKVYVTNRKADIVIEAQP